MPDAKQARKAAQHGFKALGKESKSLSATIDALGKSAAEHHDALSKLQGAARKIKPKPDRNATIGDNEALRKLWAASRLQQASAKYEACRKEAEMSLSKKGTQASMLNNLISMTTIAVEQHTGGKAGAANESRRDNRLIYLALKGLRDGNRPLDGAASATTKLPRLLKPLTEKTPISELNSRAEDAKAACTAASEIRAAFDAFVSAFDDASKVAAEGFSEAEKKDVA